MVDAEFDSRLTIRDAYAMDVELFPEAKEKYGVHPPEVTVSYSEEGIPLGYYFFSLEYDESILRILRFGVREVHRRMGIATQMLGDFVEVLNPGMKVECDVHEDNLPAQKLMKKLGFVSGLPRVIDGVAFYPFSKIVKD